MEEGSGSVSVAVTAPTGMAAINVGGQTIHSFAGVGLAEGHKDIIINKVLKAKEAVERWQKCQVLVIDEISMLDAYLFQLLDEIARIIKKKDEPFGGIQIILVGDFLQLPPVAKDKDRMFCFQSELWAKAGLNGAGE